MLQDRISRRYAKSIFDLAIEKNILESLYREFRELDTIIQQNRDFYYFLHSPVISSEKKIDILEKLFRGKASDVIVNFLILMTRRKREELLPLIAQDFIDMYHAYKNITIVEVVSSEHLPKEIRQAIQNKIEATYNTKVQLISKADPSIIGGFKLLIGNYIYDLTVNSALRKLKKAVTTA
ncbi:MAG: ATP synthase F1 subunit delta [Bacteroidia bacterium]|nr:ATP synthase F1 subunit delta [Bacteroidia bacterium]MDW8157428.1 ATP synthase F1 subunit delta [Bacteroidia bacterium]